MDSKKIIRTTEDFVINNITKHDSAHDWLHIDRVRRMALFICKEEKSGNPLIVEVSALLHEIGDRKFNDDSGEDVISKMRKMLLETGLNEQMINEIIFISKNISFSKGYKGTGITDEFKIIQDADRLDAIGAIGIARAFSYGGFTGVPLFDPEGHRESTIKHFYDKLLKLKDLMNTETAKKLAEERHIYMAGFLDRFYQEWNTAGNVYC